MLKIVYPICCGISAHNSFVFVCIAVTDEKGITNYKIHIFPTFIKGLREFSKMITPPWNFHGGYQNI
jgi:transposase